MAKEVREKQRRSVSNNSNNGGKKPLEPSIEEVYNSSQKKAVSQNFLRKGKVQGGGQ